MKELAEPATKLAEETGSKGKEELTDQILFDFNDELEVDKKEVKGKTDAGTQGQSSGEASKESKLIDADSVDPSELLENLLGLDLSPETESAQDALDLGLGLCGSESEAGKEKDGTAGAATGSLINIGAFKSKGASISVKLSCYLLYYIQLLYGK